MKLLPQTKSRAEWLSQSCYSAWSCFKGFIHVTSVGLLLFLQELSFRLYSFKAEKDERRSHNINPFTETLILLFSGYYPKPGKIRLPWV